MVPIFSRLLKGRLLFASVCHLAFKCAISTNRVVSCLYLGKDWVLCPELSRRVKRIRSMYKHLGNPPPAQLPTISSVACGILTCLCGRKNHKFSQHSPVWTKTLHLGASSWHLRSLTETAGSTEGNGEPASGFSLQLFHCRQNRIQVHAALILSSYSSTQISSFQHFIIMELCTTCTQGCKDTLNIWVIRPLIPTAILR